MNDAGVLSDPVDTADLVRVSGVVHCQNTIAQIVAIAVRQLNLLAVQSSDDVLYGRSRRYCPKSGGMSQVPSCC